MTDLTTFFSPEEWEALCDQCGLCCLYKIEDADSHEIFYTRVVCPFYQETNSLCAEYDRRFEVMPTCIKISPEHIAQQAQWLPRHCAYRCIFEERELPNWHPLFQPENRKNSQNLIKKLITRCKLPHNSKITLAQIQEIMHQTVLPKNENKIEKQMIRNVIDDIEI